MGNATFRVFYAPVQVCSRQSSFQKVRKGSCFPGKMNVVTYKGEIEECWENDEVLSIDSHQDTVFLLCCHFSL